MSVLIKGAKMPTNCRDCDLYRHCDVPFNDEYFKRDSGRPSDCPLVEIPPHGDLIEKEELLAELELEMSEYKVNDIYISESFIRIYWQGEVGFGTYDLRFGDDGRILGYSECMDRDKDKTLLRKLLNAIADKVEIVE